MSHRRRGAAPARRWLALLAGFAALALPAAPAAAAAQEEVFVEVNPSTIQAGFQVGIRASCGDDLNPATVRSDAFRELTLTPRPGSRMLAGSATVPSSTRPGQYRVNLRCVDGATATAELFVLNMAQPTRGPKTGGGGTAGAGLGQVGILLAGAGAAALAGGMLLLGYRRRTG